MALGSLSAGAAVVHFAVTPEHFRENVLFGLFFVVVATLQLAWGAAVIARESRSLYLGGAVGNALILGVWALSRTTGLPLGPDAGSPEPVGLLDGLATVYQAVVVGGSLHARFKPGSALSDRWAAVTPGWPSAIVVYALPALGFIVGGHDHGLGVVPHVDVHLGHHFLHLVFFGGASIVFGLYVAFLVRESGPPRFSWRLDPEAPRSR